jgi:hypothetical protein
VKKIRQSLALISKVSGRKFRQSFGCTDTLCYRLSDEKVRNRISKARGTSKGPAGVLKDAAAW